MSDIRTKLLVGTSFGALAMIFVMAAGVDAFNTDTANAVQSGNVYGHATVMAIHPDGSASYSQGDNLITDLGKDAAVLQLFDGTAATAGLVFNCITMGTGAGGGQAISSALAVTGQQCDNDVATPNAVSNTVLAPLGTSGGSTADIIAVFPALVAGDLTTNPGVSVDITEAALGQAGAGATLSSVPITTVTGVLGTVVTITYTMTVD